MNKKSRFIRVFISSTFSDMAHERRILHEHVFPELTRLCASRGARFQAVDLRWGVNEESQLDHKTMDLCLGEIERCQRLSPKPNFLVLLGDRYGWEPVPARILSDEFEELHAHASAAQTELLNRWYGRDDNAVPAQHVMKRRDEDFNEYHEWAPEEAKLLQVVRELVDKVSLKGDARDKYFQSATHQEIVRGALSQPTVPDNMTDPGEHVLACFRTIEGLPQKPNTFFDDRSAELDALQAELRSRLAETDDSTDNVYSYNAAWQPADQDDIALEDASAFAQRVLEHFTRVITAQLDGLEGMSTLEAEQQAQQQFRDDRCRHFAGREETLTAIDAYLDGDENRVMALIGSGGSGKSALMAEATKRVEQRPGLLIYRFIGATPDSTLIDSVLRSIASELAEVTENTDSIPTRREELVKYLAGLLGRATPEQPITIVVDALDQLTEADARQLDWLPEELPANAKLIVSALPELEAALDKTQQIGVPRLSDEAGEVILKAWLSDVGRKLQPEQHAAVIKSFATNGLPLYLKLAFEQARHWGSTEGPSGLPADIDGMIGAMLDVLEKDHTPSRILESAEVVTAPLVQTALGLLQAARHGLAENELLDVVSADEVFFNAYKQTTHHELSEERLPIAVWSRLYLDLAPYLVEREAQDVVVLGFFHRQVGDVIGQRYGSENDGQRSHAQLATYFGGQENFLDDARKQPNGRRLGELPYQQLHSAQWQALEATLTDFDLLMATCQAGMQGQLAGDYHEAWQQLQTAGYSDLRLWEAFLRERAHILARGNEEWGAHKILLQLAVEHADDSPVTAVAEEWLESGNCDWQWLRRILRPHTLPDQGVLRSFEKHSRPITGVQQLDGDVLLSWDAIEIKAWNIHSGEMLESWSTGAPLNVWVVADVIVACFHDTPDCVQVIRSLPLQLAMSYAFDFTVKGVQHLDSETVAVHGYSTYAILNLAKETAEKALKIAEPPGWESAPEDASKLEFFADGWVLCRHERRTDDGFELVLSFVERDTGEVLQQIPVTSPQGGLLPMDFETNSVIRIGSNILLSKHKSYLDGYEECENCVVVDPVLGTEISRSLPTIPHGNAGAVEIIRIYAQDGDVRIAETATGLLAWTPEGKQNQLSLDLDSNDLPRLKVELYSPYLAYINNPPSLIEWDISASTSREITVPDGMNTSAFMFIGRIGNWLFMTRKQHWDTDTGWETMAQPLIAIHTRDGITKKVLDFSHQNDVKLLPLEGGTVALIMDKRVLLFDPEFSFSYEPKLDRNLGIVLSVSEDWSNPMRWMAVGPKGAELINLESDSISEPIKTRVGCAAGAEFKDNKMIIWGDLRGMAELGHPGDFAIIESGKDGRWSTRNHLMKDDIQLEALMYGATPEELKSKIPNFTGEASYSTTFVGEYVVVVQDPDLDWGGAVFLFKGTQFLDGLTDERISDPFWVQGDRLLFRVPPNVSEDSPCELPPAQFFSVAILDDKLGAIEPVTLSDLGLAEPSDETQARFMLCDNKGNSFRPYRDMSYGGMGPVCLTEIGTSDALPSCVDGRHQDHGKQHVSIRIDDKNTLRWHAPFETAFILHRIAYENIGWEMFETFTRDIPALTPVLSSETFFVWESDGTAVPITVVNPESSLS